MLREEKGKTRNRVKVSWAEAVGPRAELERLERFTKNSYQEKRRWGKT